MAKIFQYIYIYIFEIWRIFLERERERERENIASEYPLLFFIFHIFGEIAH